MEAVAAETFNGRIYIIRCGAYYYYGSCTTSIARRKALHKHKSALSNRKLYQYIRGKDWTIEQVAEVECKTVGELREIENTYICQHLGSPYCLNDRQAKGYNKHRERARKRRWYLRNREAILERLREQRQIRKQIN